MIEEKTIIAFYEQDHERLDELFKTFQKLKRSDFVKGKEAFKEFKFGLQRHIVWEEDLLFPLWEKKTGMSEGGPTFVMRAEHRLIGQQLETIQGPTTATRSRHRRAHRSTQSSTGRSRRSEGATLEI
jgi:iron-sulfur cluster repair protein YtfE (RIC family)